MRSVPSAPKRLQGPWGNVFGFPNHPTKMHSCTFPRNHGKPVCSGSAVWSGPQGLCTWGSRGAVRPLMEAVVSSPVGAVQFKPHPSRQLCPLLGHLPHNLPHLPTIYPTSDSNVGPTLRINPGACPEDLRA